MQIGIRHFGSISTNYMYVLSRDQLSMFVYTLIQMQMHVFVSTYEEKNRKKKTNKKGTALACVLARYVRSASEKYMKCIFNDYMYVINLCVHHQ